MSATEVRHVDVRGRRLAVQVRGSGPTVVLEMGGGFGGIGPYWHGVDEELTRFCRVVVYDRAGLGGSERIEEYPTMGERAQDLAALLDALEIREPALIAGWSLGGLIVQNFAVRYPERVGGLLLIDPTPPDFLERTGSLGRWGFSAAFGFINRMQLFLARAGLYRTQFGRYALRRLAAPQWGPRMPHEYAERILDALAQPSSHRALILETARLLEACAETNRWITERGLPSVPFMVLAATHRAGNAEKMRPRKLFARILEAAPAAELRELPGIGHMVPPEAPDSVIQAVRELLARMSTVRHSNGTARLVTGTQAHANATAD
jgi:pimeloyl-ACP methyl ester carboxylesterase